MPTTAPPCARSSRRAPPSSVAHLRAAHPEWEWRIPAIATEDALLAVHTPAHLARLQGPPDFDDDTPYFEGIYDHARRSVGAALAAMNLALVQHEKAFALMRPPGHHATAGQAMGFCYLNQVAMAAVAARARGAQRVAVWDFDAHHGNGTEAILDGREGFLFCSIHQFPAYPGTGTRNTANCRNYPIAPAHSARRPPGGTRPLVGRHRRLPDPTSCSCPPASTPTCAIPSPP